MAVINKKENFRMAYVHQFYTWRADYLFSAKQSTAIPGHINDPAVFGNVLNKGFISLPNFVVIVHTNILVEFYNYQYENFELEPIKMSSSILPLITSYLTSNNLPELTNDE